MPRKSPYKIELTSDEQRELQALARKYTSPYFSVLRARMILMAAEGLQNDQIAASLSVPRQIVSKWRKRFFEERLIGLPDQSRTGRPPVFPPRSGRSGKSPGL